MTMEYNVLFNSDELIGTAGYLTLKCRAHWGMGLIFHQAKPRWKRRGERER